MRQAVVFAMGPILLTACGDEDTYNNASVEVQSCGAGYCNIKVKVHWAIPTQTGTVRGS